MALMGLLIKALGLGAIVLITQYVLAYLQSPLKKLPGPFLAKFSNIWRFFNHYGQTHIETQRKLHEKHGDYVRLGPNTVSIADASLIKTIYNTRGTFVKSDFYWCVRSSIPLISHKYHSLSTISTSNVSHKDDATTEVCQLNTNSPPSINDALQDSALIPNMFSTRSNAWHSSNLRPVQKLYNHQSALELESLMDDDLRELCHQLRTRFVDGANEGKTCDISDWISFFAWDFMAHTTWSKRIGFMERAEDVGGMLGTAERVMRYFSVVRISNPRIRICRAWSLTI
jgi:hypothetical protein